MEIAITVILAILVVGLIAKSLLGAKDRKKLKEQELEKEQLQSEYYKLKILELKKHDNEGGDN